MAPTAPVSTMERASARSAWIDTLRVVVIVGVIGSHVALIYALDVGWYYEELTASTVGTVLLAVVFSPGLLFGMGLLFLVAGLFTPPALTRKGARRFLTDRLWRLGIPSLAYLLLVNPAMNFVGDHAMGQGETIGDYFRRTYADDIEFGIAWFMVALLVFSIGYTVWRHLHRTPADRTRLRTAHLVGVAAFIVVASFLVRLIWPFLGTEAAWTLNLWEWPQMAALFAIGAAAAERGWLAEGLSPALRKLCGWAAVIGIGLTAVLAATLTLSEDPDPFLGGLRVEALLIPAIEATLTLGMSLWAVDLFRRRVTVSGRLLGAMGAGSFGAYLVHAPITVLGAAGLRGVRLPAEAKFAIVFALTASLAFGLGWIAGRSPREGQIV